MFLTLDEMLLRLASARKEEATGGADGGASMPSHAGIWLQATSLTGVAAPDLRRRVDAGIRLAMAHRRELDNDGIGVVGDPMAGYLIEDFVLLAALKVCWLWPEADRDGYMISYGEFFKLCLNEKAAMEKGVG